MDTEDLQPEVLPEGPVGRVDRIVFALRSYYLRWFLPTVTCLINMPWHDSTKGYVDETHYRAICHACAAEREKRIKAFYSLRYRYIYAPFTWLRTFWRRHMSMCRVVLARTYGNTCDKCEGTGLIGSAGLWPCYGGGFCYCTHARCSKCAGNGRLK